MIINGFDLDGNDNDRIWAFLSNPENVLDCGHCPYQFNGWPESLPCGQRNCWVSVFSNHLSGLEGR